MIPLAPGKSLERTLKDISEIFSGIPHWLCFGALWGLIRNRGVIRDCDFDMCVFYGTDWEFIAARATKAGYKIKKTVLDDTNNKALYMGMYRDDIYICVSFWYPFDDYCFWCHDQNQEVKDGPGVPVSGYYFKGCEKWMVSAFMQVEWPGIIQNIKISVPVCAGSLLDLCYPAWPYLKQRYVIKNYQYDENNCISVNDPIYFKGAKERAGSRYMVHVKSMNEFNNKEKIRTNLSESIREWDSMIKCRK